MRIGNPNRMDSHQLNPKVDPHTESISRISLQDLDAIMRGRISAVERIRLRCPKNKFVERKIDRSWVTKIRTGDSCSRGNNDFTFPSRDCVVNGVFGLGNYFSGLSQTAIDRKEKMGGYNLSWSYNMMGRRVLDMRINDLFGERSAVMEDQKESKNKNRAPSFHAILSFWKRFRCTGMIRYLLPSSLLVLVLSPFAANAWGQDQDPFIYSEISSSQESVLTFYTNTLYLSGQTVLPTTVHLPSVAFRKIGLGPERGWTYEVRTVDSPVYVPKNKDLRRRSVVTEIVLAAGPKARESDLILLDNRERIFLLHLVPHPKVISGKPFYSRDVSWWPRHATFASQGLRPVPIDHRSKNRESP